jgi:hypothetical protein
MLTIEQHAPGSYVISGYHPHARKNNQGQTVVTHEVCQIVFAEEGQNNGVTVEILQELIAKHTGGKAAPKPARDVVDAAAEANKQAQRDRMAAARAAKGKKTHELATA